MQASNGVRRAAHLFGLRRLQFTSRQVKFELKRLLLKGKLVAGR